MLGFHRGIESADGRPRRDTRRIGGSESPPRSPPGAIPLTREAGVRLPHCRRTRKRRSPIVSVSWRHLERLGWANGLSWFSLRLQHR